MGDPRQAPLVKPIVGVLASSPDLLAEAQRALGEHVSPVECASEPRPWNVSDYYRDEMGETIWRQYLALTGLADAGALVAWKRGANELEDLWRGARGRRVNVDPGYLDRNKVVLASTKDAAHRVYVADGIFAEPTLWFAHGRFRPWPHTYRDYAADDAIEFFNSVRRRYRDQLRAGRSATGRRGG